MTLHGYTAWHSRARTPAWLWAFRNQLGMVRQMGRAPGPTVGLGSGTSSHMKGF